MRRNFSMKKTFWLAAAALVLAAMVTTGCGKKKAAAITDITLHPAESDFEVELVNNDTAVSITKYTFNYDAPELAEVKKLEDNYEKANSKKSEELRNLIGEYSKHITVVFPDTIQGYPVVKVGCGNNSFVNSGHAVIQKVIIPDSVEEIFLHVGAREVEFSPSSKLETITGAGFRKSAFDDSLEKITLPPSLQKIESNAFAGTKISEIAIPQNVKRIDDEAFSKCRNLKTVDLSNATSLEYIGQFAFSEDVLYPHGDPIEKIVFPPSLKKIGKLAFTHCDELAVSGLPDPDSLKNIKLEIHGYSYSPIAVYHWIGDVFSGEKLWEAANSSDLAERKKFNDTWKDLRIELADD